MGTYDKNSIKPQKYSHWKILSTYTQTQTHAHFYVLKNLSTTNKLH